MTYEPYRIVGADRPSRWLITCDHAANTVPDFVNGGSLGLPDADMARHIAYDVGAAAVSLALGEALNAPVILSNFSRLVIDPNRGEDDPTLVMKLYDGSIIPANRYAGADEVEARLNACYRPYHGALAHLAARRDDTVLLSIHSFTKQLKGKPPRPWQVGVLYGADDRLAQILLGILRQDSALCVGENQPYGGHFPGDSVETHALSHGRPNVLVEFRNDLIADSQGQADWAARIAPSLEQALALSGV